MKPARLLAALIALVLCLPALAGGKKGGDLRLGFHMETEAGGNPKMTFAYGDKFFSSAAEVGLSDVADFNPFPSQDGEGYGVVLRFKAGPRNRLAAVTADNQGNWLLARVNGRVVDATMIDRQVTDGQLVIWRGVTQAEVQALDKKLPRIGEKKPRG